MGLGFGCDGAEPVPSADDSAIIDGAEAPLAKWDAIGSLQRDGSAYCTATLIAEDLVVSAKHCIVRSAPVSFAIGGDAKKPKRIVRVDRFVGSPVFKGGYGELGSDVALFHLAEAIDDVAPLAVDHRAWSKRDVTKGYSAFGFGRYDAVVPGTDGKRRTGKLTVRATSGRALAALYESEEDLAETLEGLDGVKLTSADRETIHTAYEHELLDGYEIFAGMAQGDAQICHGDSGGPFLRAQGSKPLVAGVVSAGITLGEVNYRCHGAFFATFGETTLALIDDALSCAKDVCAASCTGVLWKPTNGFSDVKSVCK